MNKGKWLVVNYSDLMEHLGLYHPVIQGLQEVRHYKYPGSLLTNWYNIPCHKGPLMHHPDAA